MNQIQKIEELEKLFGPYKRPFSYDEESQAIVDADRKHVLHHSAMGVLLVDMLNGVVLCKGEKPEVSKGEFGGECNRTACNKTEAIYYNHSTSQYYCVECADLINRMNKRESQRLYGHELCTLIEPESKESQEEQVTSIFHAACWWSTQGQSDIDFKKTITQILTRKPQ